MRLKRYLNGNEKGEITILKGNGVGALYSTRVTLVDFVGNFKIYIYIFQYYSKRVR